MGEYYWQVPTRRELSPTIQCSIVGATVFCYMLLTIIPSALSECARPTLFRCGSTRAFCVWEALARSRCRKASQIKYVTGGRRRGAGEMRLRTLVRKGCHFYIPCG